MYIYVGDRASPQLAADGHSAAMYGFDLELEASHNLYNVFGTVLTPHSKSFDFVSIAMTEAEVCDSVCRTWHGHRTALDVDLEGHSDRIHRASRLSPLEIVQSARRSTRRVMSLIESNENEDDERVDRLYKAKQTGQRNGSFSGRQCIP